MEEDEILEYIQGMKEYIAELSNLPTEEAEARSRKNLFEAGIIDEYGNLTEHYR